MERRFGSGANKMKGKHHTEATKKLLSELMTGKNHPLWGKHHKPETIELMRKVHTGKKCSDATKKLMSEAHKDIAFTPQHIKHLEEAQQRRREREKEK